MNEFPFRRIVLEFRRGAHSPEAVRMVAELAGLMQLDLLGRYVEDPATAQLAQLAFGREFHLLDRQWRDLGHAEAAGTLDLAIAAARRLFLQAAASAPTLRGFEVIRADAARYLRHSADEMIALIREADNSEAIAAQLRGVEGEATGALLLPRQGRRRHGPVIVIASSQEEPGVAVATRIAGSARTKLLRMSWPPDPASKIPADAMLVVLDERQFAELAGHLPALRGSIPILVMRARNGASG